MAAPFAQIMSLYQAWEIDPNLYEEYRNQFLAYAREFASNPDAARIEITGGQGNQVNFSGRSTMTKQEHQQILGGVIRYIDSGVRPGSRTTITF